MRGDHLVGVDEVLAYSIANPTESLGVTLHAATHVKLGAEAAATGPKARAAAETVYSRATGRFFIVGGDDGGQPTQDIWMYDLLKGTWSQVALEGWTPQTVLAATWHQATQRLWVLDVDGSSTVRLTSVDPQAGSSTVVGTWPRNGMFERYFLRSAIDGSLYVICSDPVGIGAHVFQLDVTPGSITGAISRKIEEGDVALSPVADVGGLTLTVEDSIGDLRAVRLRRREGDPVSVNEIADIF